MRLDSIQVGRGAAAVLVVLLHSELAVTKYFGAPITNGALLFGKAGVDFFFVLSGFIIWWVHSRDIGYKSRLANYTMRRLRRIYPTYWVALACVISIFAVMPEAGTGSELEASSLFRAILLFPNPDGQILGVAWTLCYEMLFYTLFGILIFAPIAGIVLMAGWLLGAMAFPDANSFIFAPYPAHFAMGMAAALQSRGLNLRYGVAIAAGGVCLFAACAVAEQHLGEVARHLCYAVSSMVIIVGLCSMDLKSPTSWPKPLLLLGAASYSLYLVHYPTLIGTNKLLSKLYPELSPSIALICAIAAATGAGITFHLVVERPISDFLQRRDSRMAQAAPG
ncbi:MAG: acyltransferase [Mesorhizobium sp.]|uniref:acyltransferase family protein n=1 Tax=Mesorhizobium sp. TaxID=1871066 RepID=UPI0011FACCEA|nr:MULTISPECIES: acyltransferase [unclassified Mesorhizobium]TIQ23514.1 MAG: acyltransferase [Mesorhizobium sp.]